MIGMMRMTIGMMGMEKDNKNNKDNEDNKKDRGEDQVIGTGTFLTLPLDLDYLQNPKHFKEQLPNLLCKI